MRSVHKTPAKFDPAHWKAFLASVETLNAFVALRRLCRYQSDILNLGHFEVVSPRTGEVLKVTRSHVLNGRIAYHLPDVVPSWLMTDNFARKYRLCYLITENRVHTLFDIPVRGSNSRHEKGLISFQRRRAALWEELQRMEAERPPAAEDSRESSDGAVTFAIGHANFAHHLWNELPALDEWLQQATDERLDRLTIIALREPLGPLEKIFPRLSRANIVRDSETARSSLRSAEMVVRGGAQFVPTRLRERLRDYCRSCAQPNAMPTLHDDAQPRVWMSVRVKSRTAENLDEFLLETIAKFFEAYPSGEILLDGFSFPIDFQNDPRMEKYRDTFLQLSKGCDTFIDNLLAQVRTRLGARTASRVLSVSGIDIASAVTLAGRCRFYVCHGGSLQHKVAWFHNIPGVMHTRGDGADWHADQTENGVVPDAIPSSLIRPTKKGPNSGPVVARNFMYTITDAGKAAEFTISTMKSRLEAGQGSSNGSRRHRRSGAGSDDDNADISSEQKRDMDSADETPAEFDPARWKAFLASVEKLNTFTATLRLRQYQADILDHGRFEIVSPDTGEPVGITRSSLSKGRVAYRIPDAAPSWLLTDNFARQFKLCYLVTKTSFHTLFDIPIEGANTPHEKGLKAFRRQHTKLRNDLLRKEERSQPKAGKKQRSARGDVVTMAIGHPNFAHHLWNELPALDEWLQHATDESLDRLTILPLWEPLGPLEKIFPRLSRAEIVRGRDGAERKRMRSASLLVHPGARFIPIRLRERVRDYCASSSTMPALSDDAWPRVWISVRLKSRTADNLEDFLLETIVRIFTVYPNSEILLDGFSFPVGFFEDPRTEELRDKFAQTSTDCDAFIATLRERVLSRVGKRWTSKVRSVSGLDLASAITMAGRCHFYVCHGGTLQHKVAWTHNIPGLVHGLQSSVHWHADQIEGGRIPDRIPTRWISRTNEPSSGPVVARNFNYTITDLNMATRYIISSMRRRLGTPGREAGKAKVTADDGETTP